MRYMSCSPKNNLGTNTNPQLLILKKFVWLLIIPIGLNEYKNTF